jgi:hypothetical protein
MLFITLHPTRNCNNLNNINKRFTNKTKTKTTKSDVIETPEQINIRLRKAIENKYK